MTDTTWGALINKIPLNWSYTSGVAAHEDGAIGTKVYDHPIMSNPLGMDNQAVAYGPSADPRKANSKEDCAKACRFVNWTVMNKADNGTATGDPWADQSSIGLNENENWPPCRGAVYNKYADTGVSDMSGVADFTKPVAKCTLKQYIRPETNLGIGPVPASSVLIEPSGATDGATFYPNPDDCMDDDMRRGYPSSVCMPSDGILNVTSATPQNLKPKDTVGMVTSKGYLTNSRGGTYQKTRKTSLNVAEGAGGTLHKLTVDVDASGAVTSGLSTKNLPHDAGATGPSLGPTWMSMGAKSHRWTGRRDPTTFDASIPTWNVGDGSKFPRCPENPTTTPDCGFYGNPTERGVPLAPPSPIPHAYSKCPTQALKCVYPSALKGCVRGKMETTPLPGGGGRFTCQWDAATAAEGLTDDEITQIVSTFQPDPADDKWPWARSFYAFYDDVMSRRCNKEVPDPKAKFDGTVPDGKPGFVSKVMDPNSTLCQTWWGDVKRRIPLISANSGKPAHVIPAGINADAKKTANAFVNAYCDKHRTPDCECYIGIREHTKSFKDEKCTLEAAQRGPHVGCAYTPCMKTNAMLLTGDQMEYDCGGVQCVNSVCVDKMQDHATLNVDKQLNICSETKTTPGALPGALPGAQHKVVVHPSPPPPSSPPPSHAVPPSSPTADSVWWLVGAAGGVLLAVAVAGILIYAINNKKR